MDFAAKIAKCIRKHRLIGPGERVGVAVSGGADSVAMLRALLELRGELGCVLAVVHFNHRIRPEAESDAEFVEGLAKEHGLEFFGGSGDARGYASKHRMSLEMAARELRYGFFDSLALDKIATAHTLDDQAETVLMKLLRGAGTKGLSGIWPVRQYRVPSTEYHEKQVPRSARDDNQNQTQGPSTRASRSLGMTTVKRSAGAHTIQIIRPMLGVRREAVEMYLRDLGQDWREDASNRDVKHTRNKVRHELLPLLEREYNPNIYQQLADAAEVARAEEEYWGEEIRKQDVGGRRQEKQSPGRGPSTALASASFARDDKQNQTQGPSARAKAGRSLGMTTVRDSNRSETRHDAPLRDGVLLSLDVLRGQPLAVQRRVLRQCFEQASGKSLDFGHTDALVRFLERRESGLLQLLEHWFAVLDWPRRTVSFERRSAVRKDGTGENRKTSKPKKKAAGSRR